MRGTALRALQNQSVWPDSFWQKIPSLLRDKYFRPKIVSMIEALENIPQNVVLPKGLKRIPPRVLATNSGKVNCRTLWEKIKFWQK